MQSISCNGLTSIVGNTCSSKLLLPCLRTSTFQPFSSNKARQLHRSRTTHAGRRQSKHVVAASEDEELPPWARAEKDRELRSSEKRDLPFGVYLLTAAVVAIAATGSWFEFANKNAVFGVLRPDNPLWAITLGFFGVTGYPTAGYLFYRAIQAANKDFERADQIDGY